MFRTLKKPFALFLAVAVLAAGIPYFGTGGIDLLFNNITADAATKYTTDGFVYTVSGGKATIVDYEGIPIIVSIPSTLEEYTVTEIGEGAFSSDLTLLSLTIPDTVVKIGDKAFYNCYGLRTLSLGSGLQSIGELAFGRCSNLTSVTIPKSVSFLGDGAFAYCTALVGFTVASGSLTFSSTGNILFNSTKTSIIAYPASRDGDTFTVPSTVKSIGCYAFTNAKLDKVVLGSKVETINAYAFAGSSVKTVDMTESGLTTIGAYAFEGCTKLSAVSLPGTVSAVSSGAFSGCTALMSVKLSSKMTTLSDYLFDGCKELSELSIPSTLKTIGKAAFRNCSSLSAASVPDSVTKMGDEAFKGCSSLKTFTLGSGVDSVSGSMFEGCTKLAEFKVTEDDYYSATDGVLMNKAKTKIVCYPAGKSASSYTVPSSVTRIGKSAFYKCLKLKSLTIPATVTTIDDGAVFGCTSLTIYCTENSAADKYFSENTSGYDTLRVSGTSPAYVVSSASGKTGGTVTITVSIENNPGLVAAGFTVKYDATQVSLQSVKAGSVLKGFSYKDYPLSSQCKISFSDDNVTKDIKTNGVLVTLTFKLLSIFTSGSSAITVIPDKSNTYNVDLDEVTIKSATGKITVGGSSESGDVNGDGSVDGKDATILRRYVSGWANITVNNDAADVNGDGSVNGKDATILRRYVSGWPGITLS
jgi:hypothetical protein